MYPTDPLVVCLPTLEPAANSSEELDFDIDVDISPLLGTGIGPTLVDSRWYRLAESRLGRSEKSQGSADRMLHNAMLAAQWRATIRLPMDRRRAVRVPLLSRVRGDHDATLTATNISMSGLRCSGEPSAPVMDVEFRVPGLAFPIDARVEVMSYQPSNVIPLVGLRFVELDNPYRNHIARYIDRRRRRDLRRQRAA